MEGLGSQLVRVGPCQTPQGLSCWCSPGCAHTGYNVTRTMGVTMAKLSPSRGFAAELATSLVILVASQ